MVTSLIMAMAWAVEEVIKHLGVALSRIVHEATWTGRAVAGLAVEKIHLLASNVALWLWIALGVCWGLVVFGAMAWILGKRRQEMYRNAALALLLLGMTILGYSHMPGGAHTSLADVEVSGSNQFKAWVYDPCNETIPVCESVETTAGAVMENLSSEDANLTGPSPANEFPVERDDLQTS